MADFTILKMEGNNGNVGAPNWVEVGPTAAHEVRWSDVSTQDNVASAAWAAMIRPGATQIVSYTYAFTADATGTGFIGTAGPPIAWARTSYLWARWNWDNTGTFASAPIWTAYPSSAHGAPTPGDGSLLGGSADTLNVNNYSYLKGTAWGQLVVGGSAPGAGPGADPLVTAGTAGGQVTTGAASWCAWQSLQGDIDWIYYSATPAATTANQWNLLFCLFTGPNMTPALYVIVMSMKYTWT